MEMNRSTRDIKKYINSARSYLTMQVYKSPILYKKNRAGLIESAVLIVSLKVAANAVSAETNGTATLQRTTFRPEGKTPLVYTSVITAKATKSAQDVAITKAEHKVVLMKRKGWTESLEEAKEGKFIFKPMLLNNYEKHKAKVKFPCWISPKLDGVRCLWNFRTKQLVSRGGKQYRHELIESLLADAPDHFDGELYVPNTPLQDIVSLVKNGSTEPTFYIFDMPIDPEEKVTGVPDYHQRMTFFKHLYLKLYKGTVPGLEVVKRYTCYTHEDIQEKHNEFIQQGYEGSVIRNFKGMYEWNKRSYDVLKYKPVFCEEFQITGWEADELSSGGQGIAFICITRGGQRFRVVPAWSHDERRKALRHAYGSFNGFDLTVEFRGWTKDKVPSHAVGIAVRDYE
jgi:DNA ligase-1